MILDAPFRDVDVAAVDSTRGRRRQHPDKENTLPVLFNLLQIIYFPESLAPVPSSQTRRGDFNYRD